MRVLHVVRRFHPLVGGVERATRNLCMQLNRRGYQADVVTLDRDVADPGSRKLPTTDSVDGITVHRIPSVGAQRAFFAPAVLGYCDKYDILHIHNTDFFLDFLALTKSLHNKPLVVSTHGGFFHTNRLRRIKWLYFNTITRASVAAADAVVADSAHDKELFSHVRADVVVIPNGIDTDKYYFAERSIQRGNFIAIGRLAVNKRVDRLLRVLAHLAASDPEVCLTIVGADFDNLGTSLARFARRLGVGQRVRFTGSVSDAQLLRHLSRAQFFLQASDYEAFGISVLEAMSSGVVPVVNNIPAFRELVDHNRTGFLVDFSEPESVAHLLHEILDMPSLDYGRMAHEARRSTGSYAWDRIADRFEAVYRTVTGDQTNP